MDIERSLVDQCGGADALAAAVAAYADAVERHRFTVGEAAPTAPDLVVMIAHAGGMGALTIVDPPPEDAPRAPPEPRSITALEFRRRLTAAERSAITLAASRGLEQGDATLQLWIDDLNSALAVPLDSAEAAQGLAGLVALGLLDAGRVEELLA